MISVRVGRDGRKVIFNGNDAILVQRDNAFKVMNSNITLFNTDKSMHKDIVKLAMLNAHSPKEAYNFLMDIGFQYSFDYKLGGAQASSAHKFAQELGEL